MEIRDYQEAGQTTHFPSYNLPSSPLDPKSPLRTISFQDGHASVEMIRIQRNLEQRKVTQAWI